MYRNIFDIVESVNRDYPGLIGDGTRYGQFVDQVAHRANKRDGVVVWGRKARNSNGSNPNGDALTYLNDPMNRGKKTLVDIIVAGPDPGTINDQAEPSWQEYLGDNVGNGFWTEPIGPDLDTGAPPMPQPGPTPPPSGLPLYNEQATIHRGLQANEIYAEAGKLGDAGQAFLFGVQYAYDHYRNGMSEEDAANKQLGELARANGVSFP